MVCVDQPPPPSSGVAPNSSPPGPVESHNDLSFPPPFSPPLGGDSRTVVVVTCSADPQHATETLQALRFGEQCAAVQNNALARYAPPPFPAGDRPLRQ